MAEGEERLKQLTETRRRTYRRRRAGVALGLAGALVGAGMGVEAGTHALQKTADAIKGAEQQLYPGAVVSGLIKGVDVVNDFNEEGILVPPYGVADIQGDAIRLELPERLPKNLNGRIVTGPSYELPANLTPEQLRNLAEAWNLPGSFINFNSFSSGEDGENLGLYFEPAGFYDEIGRPIAIPLNYTQRLQSQPPTLNSSQ